VVDTAQEKLRNMTACKPEDNDCKPDPSRNAGPGRRG
jgi:hypothetical protein